MADLTNYLQSAENLYQIETEVVATKRQGIDVTDEQQEELNHAVNTTLSCIADALNDGATIFELAQAAQEFIEVDANAVFGGYSDDNEQIV